MSTVTDTVYLRCVGGTSNKVYRLELIDEGGGVYSCKYGFARYGATLKEGYKVRNVSYAEAYRAFIEKRDIEMAKGYRKTDNLYRFQDDEKYNGLGTLSPYALPPSVMQAVADKERERERAKVKAKANERMSGKPAATPKPITRSTPKPPPRPAPPKRRSVIDVPERRFNFEEDEK